MRCYKVRYGDQAIRLVATQGDARTMRTKMAMDFEVKPKEIETEQVEVPLQKDKLLEFINATLPYEV